MIVSRALSILGACKIWTSTRSTSLLEQLEAQERDLSLARQRLHDRIGDFPDSAARANLESSERELSKERRDLHRRIDELRARRDELARSATPAARRERPGSGGYDDPTACESGRNASTTSGSKSSPALAGDLGAGGLGRHRAAVRLLVRHGVEDVRHREDSRGGRDVHAAKSAWVAQPVPTLRRGDHAARSPGSERRHRRDDPRPSHGCSRISSTSAGESGPGFVSVEVETAIMPMSWSRKPWASCGSAISSGATISVSASASCVTRAVWAAVSP